MEASFEHNNSGFFMGTDTPSPGRRSFTDYSKIHVPVVVRDLIAKKLEGISEGRVPDTFDIGNHSFNTIKLIGRVHDSELNHDSSVTYKLKDVELPGDDTFKVIRYRGEDNKPPMQVIDIGKLVLAVGKLKAYADEFSLVSFHVREVDNKQDVEIFELEARVAKPFYEKDVLNQSVLQMEVLGVPMLLATGPVRVESGYTPTNSASTPSINTPLRSMHDSSSPSPNSTPRLPLSAQRNKILKYIKSNQESELGVRKSDIQSDVKYDNERGLEADLQYLKDNGHIYNTVDGNSYAATVI